MEIYNDEKHPGLYTNKVDPKIGKISLYGGKVRMLAEDEEVEIAKIAEYPSLYKVDHSICGRIEREIKKWFGTAVERVRLHWWDSDGIHISAFDGSGIEWFLDMGFSQEIKLVNKEGCLTNVTHRFMEGGSEIWSYERKGAPICPLPADYYGRAKVIAEVSDALISIASEYDLEL